MEIWRLELVARALVHTQAGRRARCRDKTVDPKIQLSATTGQLRCKSSCQTQSWRKNNSLSGSSFTNNSNTFSTSNSSQRHPTWSRGRCSNHPGENDKSTGGQLNMDTRNGLDRCEIARSDARQDVCNHDSSRCAEAKPIFEIRGEVLSVLPQSVVKHPFELHRQDKIPEPAVIGRVTVPSLCSWLQLVRKADPMNLELLVETLCWERSSRGSSLTTGAIFLLWTIQIWSKLFIIMCCMKETRLLFARGSRVLLGKSHWSNFKETSSNTIQFWSSILRCAKLLSCGDKAQ